MSAEASSFHAGVPWFRSSDASTRSNAYDDCSAYSQSHYYYNYSAYNYSAYNHSKRNHSKYRRFSRRCSCGHYYSTGLV